MHTSVKRSRLSSIMELFPIHALLFLAFLFLSNISLGFFRDTYFDLLVSLQFRWSRLRSISASLHLNVLDPNLVDIQSWMVYLFSGGDRVFVHRIGLDLGLIDLQIWKLSGIRFAVLKLSEEVTGSSFFFWEAVWSLSHWISGFYNPNLYVSF